MTEICINTEEVLKIGSVESGEIVGENGPTPAAFRVLEEIDREQYLEFVKEQKLLHRVKASIYNNKYNFYRVLLLD